MSTILESIVITRTPHQEYGGKERYDMEVKYKMADGEIRNLAHEGITAIDVIRELADEL